jgi:NAD-dependent deacetylase
VSRFAGAVLEQGKKPSATMRDLTAKYRCREPDVVAIGALLEAAWPGGYWNERALRDCDLLLVIGSSGHVAPVANFARSARYAGAHTVLRNLEPAKEAAQFGRVIYGKAEQLLPQCPGMD